jgi:hypothetical protein
MTKKIIINTNETLSFTYWIGRKDMNRFLSDLDLCQEGEGVFWHEKGILSFNRKEVIDEKWKSRFVKRFTEGYDVLGFEICNLVFNI